MGYRGRGELIHKICEEIVRGGDFQLDEKALLKLIQKARKEKKIEIHVEEFWSFFENMYLRWAESFMNFESEWRKKHPKTQTIFLEKKFESYIKAGGKTLF